MSENASDAMYEALCFEHHEEVHEHAPTVDEQWTPSTQETEQPVDWPPFGEQRCFEPVQPSDTGLDVCVRRSTRERRRPTPFGDNVYGHSRYAHQHSDYQFR